MKSERLAGLDLFRGLIMVIMALDHASYFAAKIHRYEFWGLALPSYAALYPLCFLYRKFKSKKPLDSIWRFF